MRPASRFSASRNDGNAFVQLLARGHQGGSIGERPSVVLCVRNLHPVRIQLLNKCNHLLEMIEILPMHDQIHRECNLCLSNGTRKFDLMRVRLRTRNPVRRFFARILKADLDVIESGANQRCQPLLIQSNARGDEIGVKPRTYVPQRQFSQIRPRQRFATSEVRVQHAQLACLLKDAGPLASRKLRLRSRQLQGIRAVDAVQRAAVRDFGDECERIGQFVIS